MSARKFDKDGANDGSSITAVNPFVAALLGATLLSGDPAASLATQASQLAIPPAPPAVVLAARPAASGMEELKDLLGDVRPPLVHFIFEFF